MRFFGNAKRKQGQEQTPEQDLLDSLLQAREKLSPERVKQIADMVAEHGEKARTVLAAKPENGQERANSDGQEAHAQRNYKAEVEREVAYKPSEQLLNLVTKEFKNIPGTSE